MDVAALRMLAQIYLEDRVLPERTDEILSTLSNHIREPVWEDAYLAVLNARNSGAPFAEETAKKLLAQLKENDHRRQWVIDAFSLA